MNPTCAYDEGMLAAWNGKEMHQNPHALFHADKNDFIAWMAGWCHSKQGMPKEGEPKAREH